MRSLRFTFMCTPDERAALERLAAFWRRSKSDVVRLLVARALEDLFMEEDAALAVASKTGSTERAKRQHGPGGPACQ